MQPLLDESQSPLYEVINPGGSAPVLISCDHGGRQVPNCLDNLGLDQIYLDRHIAYDIGARQVSKILSHKFDAPLLVANYSRLVVDLNRHFDDPTQVPEVSDHIHIPGNTGISQEHRQQRIDELFTPYHQQFTVMVDTLIARFERPIILAVHSFTPQIQGVDRPWEFGVLWDQHEELARAVMDNLEKIGGLCVGDNQPYHACDPLGYAMVVHAQDRDVEMALIEIRQDLVHGYSGQDWAADILYEVLAPLLDSTPRQHLKGMEGAVNG
jgi:predicted N-formylglutamate amidohydrolase